MVKVVAAETRQQDETRSLMDIHHIYTIHEGLKCYDRNTVTFIAALHPQSHRFL